MLARERLSVAKGQPLPWQQRSSMLARKDYGNEDINPYCLIIKELYRQTVVLSYGLDILYFKKMNCYNEVEQENSQIIF